MSQGAEWFDNARLGLFIHWGHCSQKGRELSWPMVGGVGALPEGQDLSVAEYYSTAPNFNPVQFDARQWARLARRAGARYAMLTSKHHDGYALFHTRHSDFSIASSPFKRDIVREFVDAFRAEGVKPGLYFSLCDWHHPDYPAFQDADRPYRFGRQRLPTDGQWSRFVEFMFGQVRELLTNYGPIAALWFDGGWERSAEQWRSADLYKMIKELQPDCLVNDRLPGFGDYLTPEQFVPATAPGPRWETCMTINESWGYNPADTRLKTSRELVHRLSEIAGRGGNLLLNISPTGQGLIPAEQVERLEEMGAWMKVNGEAVHDTRPALEPWQFYGPTTRKRQRTYLHLLMNPVEAITVRGIAIKRVRRVTALHSGTPLKFHTRAPIADVLFKNPDPLGELTIEMPEGSTHKYSTVVAIDMN